jgi:hypothetical protein
MWGILGQLLGLISILIYVSILVVGIIGYILFIRAQLKQIALWWLSLMGNTGLFLYFSGSYGLNNLVYFAQIFVVIVWPLINISWLLDIVFSMRKKIEQSDKDTNISGNIKKILFELAIIISIIAVFFYIIISNLAKQFIGGS